MKDFFKKSALESLFFPVATLFLLIVVVPLLIKYHSVYTTQYVFLFVVGFFMVFIRIISILNIHNKYIDMLLTIPIIIITSALLFVLGIFSLAVIIFYPKIVYRVGYVLSLILAFSLGVNFKFEGVIIPKNIQFVGVFNHTSFLDEVLVAIVMGTKAWTIIFAKEIRRIPVLGKMLRDYGISVDRENPDSKKVALIKSEKAIKDGKNFALFPEGKRLRPDDLKNGIVLYPFKSGAFSLACEYNLPIYPMVFLFPFSFKPRSGRWWFSPRTIKIVNLEPIPTKGKDPKQVRDEVHNIMENTIKSYLKTKKML